jgi:hypothetical protein
MKSDREVLREILEQSSRLSEAELHAFSQMFERIDGSSFRTLTQKQRHWANSVHERLGLDPGTENLVSSGRVKVTPRERKELGRFLDSLGPRPTLPPHRRRSSD